ncbi:hypothetical protein HGO34_01920 [Agrobacterium vitis]|uniref:Uncharacterized protein n=1 Tax=Agrobacterium vitis TaxID=373 RepID=A0AAE4W948_AGRVI|nr:hypothetical protein [Agrobacterium vitis]MCF1498408.1 hypothetical protein [Allorhizobium sp. Av2]MCM2438473.1 hypothetical protein [Agrobacterium vitis]MUZ56144.1 hypothetical protein [Agrobacterium vitis]MVA64718.1 hypothetical protein [Agrobacterium vitis]MVA85689.1 hypothetical protein [Agrobacterium vitis]
MRVRWYGLRTELRTNVIAAHLKKMPYRDGSPDGFVVEQLRPNFIDACLIQRLQTTHETIDPFGHQEKFELVEYLRTHFRISPDTSSLELRDPGRTGSRLISRLMEALNHRFSIEETSIDPLAWATRFREIVGVYGSIERVQIGSVAIADSAVGQLLVKGSGDIADAAIKFIAPADYSLEKVQLRFRSTRGSISFQRNASVILSSSFDEQWMDALRDSLREIQSVRVVDHS